MNWLNQLSDARKLVLRVRWLIRKQPDEHAAEQIKANIAEIMKIMAYLEKIRQAGYISIYDTATVKQVHKIIEQLKTFNHWLDTTKL